MRTAWQRRSATADGRTALRYGRTFGHQRTPDGSPDFAALVSLPGADDVVPYAPGDPDQIRLRSPQAFATSFPCPVRLFWGAEEPGVADDNRGTLQRAAAAGHDVAGIEVPGGHFTMLAAAIPRAIEFFRAH